jgi:hypothetical protein
MSFVNQSGDLHSIEEVLPAGMRTGLTSGSVVMQSKTVKVTPQGGQNLGSSTGGAGGVVGGAGNAQLSFLLSGNGGCIDLKSARLNYTVTTSGTTGPVVCDEGHPISIFNVLLGGQPVEQITNAARLTNMEMTLAGSQTYYKTAGSFQGFRLLNSDLISTIPAAGSSSVIASDGQYGYVEANLADAQAREQRAAAPQTGNLTGESRSIPLSLISGFFRARQYLPDMLGDLTITASTLAPNEFIFNAANGASTGDYQLTNISIEYKVIFPDPRYSAKLREIMMNPNDALLFAYESAIVSTGAQVAASPTSLTENTLIVSRSTNSLSRAAIAFVSSAGLASYSHLGQSCFAHAGIYSAIIRVGSSTYPNFPATGDAALFNMSLAAYGSPTNENGTITNRALWAQSTKFVATGANASYETQKAVYTVADPPVANTTNDIKFTYGDRCVVAYGFRAAQGAADDIDIGDGLNMSQASGAQLQWVIQQAPLEAYQPFVALTATRVIKCSGGAVSIVGA